VVGVDTGDVDTMVGSVVVAEIEEVDIVLVWTL
jgi:hypothetical protein